VIDNEQKKYEMRKAAFSGIQKHLERGRQLLDEISDQLGDDDPIAVKLASVMDTYTVAANTIGTFLERTQGIEDFDPEYLNQMEVKYEP
jgi:hypothetical protein